MTKRLFLTLAFIVVFLLGFTGGHIKTIMELEIETDGLFQFAADRGYYPEDIELYSNW